MTETAEPALLVLQPHLALNETTELFEALSAQLHQPVTLDASQVEHAGALCLQLIKTAQKTWESNGLGFNIASPSEAFTECSSYVGLTIQ